MDDNIFHLFTVPQRAAQPDPTDCKTPYAAFEVCPDHQDRFDIYYPYDAHGVTREVVNYGYIMRVIGVDDNHIAIVSTEGIYLIDGQHLLESLNAFKKQRLGGLRTFDDRLHLEPPASEPKVTHIRYLTNAEWRDLERQHTQESG